MEYKNFDYIIVGAGFFGSVIAERIATQKKQKVLVIDKRNHIGGNCYSEDHKETGIEYHVYGTHIFHTSNREVKEYLDQFTDFNGYRHQVLTIYKDQVYQMPINLETINSYYKMNLKPFEVEDFIAAEINKENIQNPKNLEEKAISLIGRPLYEAFIKGYTTKQWAKEPKDLPPEIINRLPFRKNYNESYFFDPWQGIPLDGYGAIFEKMLKHENITVALNTDFFDIRDQIPAESKLIYSGPIDRFFDYKFGKLEWRTLDFEFEVKDVEDFQGTSVMNYAETNVDFTRIHEPRHLHEERTYTKDKTLIIREYPKLGSGDDAYYPINTKKNNDTMQLYADAAAALDSVIFGGRLGNYKYYDMDKVIESALQVYAEKIA